ncbi:hypothetical protein GGS20DRAFT_327139 [Poronia punctata]|nr:hypothetical protein GGS20DRAFT_327139 [Poronia punctata]
MASNQRPYLCECGKDQIYPHSMSFNPRGDMLLLVGRPRCSEKLCKSSNSHRLSEGEAMCFRVDSRMLEAASTVFRDRLLSPSSKARRLKLDKKPDGVKRDIHFPDDDPHAMRVILEIIYRRYNPSKNPPMGVQSLFNFTVLTNKYDLVSRLSCWTPWWIAAMERHWKRAVLVSDSSEDMESLAWIYWTLGHKPLYACMVLGIAFVSGQDAAHRLIDGNKELCFTDDGGGVPAPPNLPCEVGCMRIEALRLIRNEIKLTLESHLEDSISLPRWCTQGTGPPPRGSDRSVRQAFVAVFEGEKLWPVPAVSDMAVSAKSLLDLFRLHPELPAFKHFAKNDGDFSCGRYGSFWSRIKHILLNTIQLQISPTSARHLEKQSKISGVADFYSRMGVDINSDRPWSVFRIEVLQSTAFKLR